MVLLYPRQTAKGGSLSKQEAGPFATDFSTMIDLAHYSTGGFDRGASRLSEISWLVVSNLFFRNHWPFPSAFRRCLLKWFGARVGKGVVIRSGVHISFPWRLSLGDFVWIGEGVRILSLAPVEIGSHVCVSQEAFLCTGSHDFSNSSFSLITQPITVGNGCWIAARAFIGPGVSIGASSLVAAGTVVTRSVPESSYVRGNPAQVQPARDVGAEAKDFPLAEKRA